MFGLDSGKKKKKAEEFVFDLEIDLKTPGERVKIKQKIEGRVQEIKRILRSGENKDEFDRLGLLLHGYTSFLRVIARIVK